MESTSVGSIFNLDYENPQSYYGLCGFFYLTDSIGKRWRFQS